MGYITEIRKKIGHDKIIHPAARILIENDQGEFLFVQRLDNGLLGLPAGSIEYGETIEQCIRREVNEECGLQIDTLTVIGISSSPTLETVVYPNKDQVQYFSIEFYSNQWSGKVQISDKEEIQKAEFLPSKYLQSLPPNEIGIVESLAYYRSTGQVLLK
ncbi:MAG: NUDIX domain-containing protein [Bacteroidia bacterium]|nr:NUDIX domain-containing protein [Bacteroidia bacterium]